MKTKSLQQYLKNIRQNYFRVNEDWFKTICNRLNYDYETTKQYYIYFCKGFFDFIENCPEILVNYIAEIKFDEQSPVYLRNGERYSDHSEFRKIVYSKKGSNKQPESIELNIMYQNDLQILLDMLSNPTLEIDYSLRMIDELEPAKKERFNNSGAKHEKTKIYEYDLITVNEESWHIKKELIIANLHNFYPSYSELFWTERFGYYNQDGKLFKSKDSFPDLHKLFKFKSKNCSSYLVTGRDSYKIIGNLFTHSHLLQPENKKALEK